MEEKGFASHSIHHFHNVLSTVLTKAVWAKKIAQNPAAVRTNRNPGVVLPKLKARRPQWVLTYGDAQSLIRRLQNRPRIAVQVSLLTGMRRGELLAIRWRDFDEGKGAIHIRQAIYDHVIDSPKTADSQRTIPISDEVRVLLLDWKQKSNRNSPDDFILTTRDGKPGDPARMLRDHIKPICKDLGLPAATWLTFRRTWATWADEEGISAKQRGAIMGNSAEINQNVYTKVIPESLRRAVAAVAGRLFTNCSQASEVVD